MLRLAMGGYPFNESRHGGPKVFMRRLGKAIEDQQLAELKSAYSPFYDIALFAIRTHSVYPKPFVVRVDGVTSPTSRVSKHMFRTMDRAAGIIFLTEYSRSLVLKHYGAVRQPYAIIPNKVDINLFKPDGNNKRNELGIDTSAKVIVASAHWRRWKRLKETVELFQSLKKQYDKEVKLIVLGGNPDYVLEDPDIFYVGEVAPDMLAPWYRTGDVYIHLAGQEPCGNTQIEAMACGLPVLCVNSGGVMETVTEANGGIVSLAEPPDNDANTKELRVQNLSFDVLEVDLIRLLEEADRFSSVIDRSVLSIEYGARCYINFLEKIYRERKL